MNSPALDPDQSSLFKGRDGPWVPLLSDEERENELQNWTESFGHVSSLDRACFPVLGWGLVLLNRQPHFKPLVAVPDMGRKPPWPPAPGTHLVSSAQVCSRRVSLPDRSGSV